MKTKKNMNITIDSKLYQIIDENFDNKAKLIQYCLVKILSKNEKYKELLKNIDL